jgi:hypothetical protein
VKSEECIKPPISSFTGQPVENSGIVDNGITDAIFEILWNAHPKRTKKPLSLRYWNKFIKDSKPSNHELLAIIEALEVQKRSLAWCENDERYIPQFNTWINNQRWNDNLGQAAKKAPKITPPHILEARRLLGFEDDLKEGNPIESL